MRGTCYRMVALAAQVNSAWARLRGGIWPVAQTSVAAGIAWYLTHNVLGHAQPFFAPIAAAVSLSASTVLRSQRALQLITGVALGIGVGVAVAAVAEGPVAIGVAVLIAMCAALAVGGGFFGHGLMFVNQTAASAILIIALHRSGSGSERLVDALIGGGVVLVISLLLFPAAPLRLIHRATRDLGIALREALSQLDEQIIRRQPAEPGWLLAVSRRIHGTLAQLGQARSTARNIVRIAPLRWRRRDTVDAANKQAAQLDLLGNSVLGLLRACQAALLAGEDIPADLRTAVGQLRAAVGGLAEQGIDNGADTATVEPVRRLAQRPPPGEAAYTPLVTSLIRACARDVLRVHGVNEGA
jgi:uncharacterized membrane protein YgaE (UPF0421/DUF939 family)